MYLTKREAQCLDLLAQGHRRQEIADILQIGIGTVKTYLLRVHEKLGVDTATGAVWEGMRLGFIDPPDREEN